MDAGSLLKVPDSWTMIEAAGFMEVTLTAYLNIFQIGGAEKGKSVLIHGGGSGVGRCVAVTAICHALSAEIFIKASEILIFVAVQCSQAIALCKAKGITTFVTAGR